MASIADTVRAAVEAEEAKTTDGAPLPEGDAPSTAAPPVADAPAVQGEEPKPGRTAGRPRDDKGRLLPGKPSAPEPTTPSAPPPAISSAAAAPAPSTPQRPQRPSSWAKDYWDHWEKLDPSVAEYILKREGDYAKGVSTYKAEAEHARKWNEAVAEFLPVLQQYGLDPIGHTRALMSAHQRLALGSPQDKLAMFAQMARDYGVPLQGLFQQGQDGQIYFNQQLLQQQVQQPQQDVRKTVQELLEEERAKQAIADFERSTEKYPHYQQVKETMAGLLQSGLADDLESAYEAALRHPRHAELYESLQQQQHSAEEAKKVEALRAQAAVARKNAISTRSATPTAVDSPVDAKNRRAVIEAAFEQHAGGGRV